MTVIEHTTPHLAGRKGILACNIQTLDDSALSLLQSIKSQIYRESLKKSIFENFVFFHSTKHGASDKQDRVYKVTVQISPYLLPFKRKILPFGGIRFQDRFFRNVFLFFLYVFCFLFNKPRKVPQVAANNTPRMCECCCT